MQAEHFFTAEAKHQVAEAVGAVEADSAAEVVVAMRRQAGHYRHADYLFGALAALATLALLLFYPRSFRVVTMPLDVAIAFALGAVACSYLPTLRRWLTAPSLRRRNVETAARAAFVELGVSRTRGRTGVLVFFAVLERQVAVVVDIGVDPAAMGAAWTAAVAALQAAAARLDWPGLVTALRGLGAPLAAALPRAADDVDELPNEPTTD